MRNETIDLAAAISDAVETASPLIALGGQSLQVNTPAEPILVNADRTRLAQVFANLLNNSARYSDAGQPIEITATAGRSRGGGAREGRRHGHSC